jgi:hypothetical protein
MEVIVTAPAPGKRHEMPRQNGARAISGAPNTTGSQPFILLAGRGMKAANSLLPRNPRNIFYL